MDKSRTCLLIGEQNLQRLSEKFVTIIGVGGVGGHVATALVRAGIEKLRLVDFDIVAPSNINRQVVAYQSTIGKCKVDVLKELLCQINPDIQIETFSCRLTKENVKMLTCGSDIVVDAIDSVQDKVELICHCKENQINIISAMGAGNRSDIPNFVLTDIYKTHDDPLAKVLRKKLKERGVKKLDVVTSCSPPNVRGRVVASISYYPAVCGNVLASAIVNKIIKEEI